MIRFSGPRLRIPGTGIRLSRHGVSFPVFPFVRARLGRGRRRNRGRRW